MAKATKTAADVVNDGAAAQPTDPKGEAAKQAPEPKPGATDLAGLARQLEALVPVAEQLGEATVARKIGWAANSARHALKAGATRRKRFGKVVAQLQKQGLTAEQIVA